MLKKIHFSMDFLPNDGEMNGTNSYFALDTCTCSTEDIIYLDCTIVLLFWPFLHGLGMTEYIEYQFPKDRNFAFSQ